MPPLLLLLRPLRHSSVVLLLAVTAFLSFMLSSDAWMLSSRSHRALRRHSLSARDDDAATPTPRKHAQIFDLTNADDTPYYPRPRVLDETLLQVDKRPGAIIETAEQLQIKDQMMQEMMTTTPDDSNNNERRNYPAWLDRDYGELAELADSAYDTDDPEALDMGTLGTWTIFDLESQFDYEWHPHNPLNANDDVDPNKAALAEPDTQYLKDTPKDADGIEVGFTAVFGPSNPIDERTILGNKDSYMIDGRTRDDQRLTPEFTPDDTTELDFNADVVAFRQSLEILETYVDPFLSEELPVPRHVAKWHGYPEQVYFAPQNYTNNRFTKDADRTDFDALSPFRARQRAVELARAKNAEWLPDGVSQAWHVAQRAPYEMVGTLMGTLRQGDIDAALVDQMQPVLDILGSSVDLLSTHEMEDGKVILRFAYHGLMKNKYGMKCWAEQMLRDDVGLTQLSNIVFETGFRRRDPAYDGGDAYYGPRHY